MLLLPNTSHLITQPIKKYARSQATQLEWLAFENRIILPSLSTFYIMLFNLLGLLVFLFWSGYNALKAQTSISL